MRIPEVVKSETVKLLWLNATFYVLFLLFSLAAIPLLSLAVAVSRPFSTHRDAMRRFRRAISWYGMVIIRVLPYPLVRVAYEDLAPESPPGPYIFVCNHRSSSDPFLMACLPYECAQVVNDWPFRLPVLGWFAGWAGYLSVTEMPFAEFSRKAIALLDQGVCVIAFPEGTRSGSRKMGQFHGSIFRVALKARRPIVPLCISGNENVPRRGSLLLRPATVRVQKLPAFEWEAYKDMSPFKLKNLARGIIARHLDALEGKP
jgi:1-acyl-sn-glycerol-3-phosphate acyltransferase